MNKQIRNAMRAERLRRERAGIERKRALVHNWDHGFKAGLRKGRDEAGAEITKPIPRELHELIERTIADEIGRQVALKLVNGSDDVPFGIIAEVAQQVWAECQNMASSVMRPAPDPHGFRIEGGFIRWALDRMRETRGDRVVEIAVPPMSRRMVVPDHVLEQAKR